MQKPAHGGGDQQAPGCRAESADARTFEHPSGLRFHGIFDGNLVSMRTLQGRGTCVNLSNDAVLARYEGEFKNGRLDGQGTVTFKDGDIFTGSLLKDRPRQGILIKPDGSKFEVEFSQSGDTCFDLFKPKPMKSKTRLVTDNSAARSGDRPRLDGSGSAQKRGRSASPEGSIPPPPPPARDSKTGPPAATKGNHGKKLCDSCGRVHHWKSKCLPSVSEGEAGIGWEGTAGRAAQKRRRSVSPEASTPQMSPPPQASKTGAHAAVRGGHGKKMCELCGQRHHWKSQCVPTEASAEAGISGEGSAGEGPFRSASKPSHASAPSASLAGISHKSGSISPSNQHLAGDVATSRQPAASSAQFASSAPLVGQPAPFSPLSPRQDALQCIARLKALLDQGALTAAEFEDTKRCLLEKVVGN